MMWQKLRAFCGPFDGVKRFIFCTLLSQAGLTLHAGTLVPLNAGMQMTCQFVNNTCLYPDDQVYVLVIANNASGQTCTVDGNGNMTPCTAGDNGSNHHAEKNNYDGFNE